MSLNAIQIRYNKSPHGKRVRTEYWQRNRDLINSFKNKPCADCQGWFDFWQMDFDHRNPNDKVANVALMLNWSKPKILKEISKCDLVCANCHRNRTYRRLHER